MLKLTYAELTDSRTLTYKAFHRIQEDIDLLEKKWARLKAFDLALTGHLQTYGEMDYELFNCAVAWFEHSDLTVSEIFQKIREMGVDKPPKV